MADNVVLDRMNTIYSEVPKKNQWQEPWPLPLMGKCDVLFEAANLPHRIHQRNRSFLLRLHEQRLQNRTFHKHAEIH